MTPPYLTDTELAEICRPYRQHAAKRRTLKIQRTPAWADLEAIRRVYEAASELTRTTGVLHHVDHVLPLNGKKVSGLHVAQNLRAIPATDNMKKRNRYEPE